jgi:hypothetical protein
LGYGGVFFCSLSYIDAVESDANERVRGNNETVT